MIITFQMNKLAIIPIFFLTMCGTAPITDDPAHAFELEIEESQWNHVYHAIEYIKRGQREKTMTDPSDSINKALAEFNNGSNDTTESEELLQLPSRID
jgi:hypothetical protein|tara:strand:+ start:93 stop:386 length:294 start_codon:yes stop_codon:yes gene_type:complete